MEDERTANPASVAGPSAEGTLMALRTEFKEVLEKYPKMCEEGDRTEWEKLSGNLDSSCTVEERAGALGFVVDRCRNMVKTSLPELSPDFKKDVRCNQRGQQLKQKALLQHVTDVLLLVFTADQTGYGDVQCGCFKYHWDCLTILNIFTQLVSGILGKGHAETDITSTVDAVTTVLDRAIGCVGRCWYLVRSPSGSLDFFEKAAKLQEDVDVAADKLAIDFLMLKFRQLMINFVCDHSYSLLKGMVVSAGLTVDKLTFIAWQYNSIQDVPKLRTIVEDENIKKGIDLISDCLDRLDARYKLDQETTDRQLTSLLGWMEPKLGKEIAPVLKLYGESVVTCFEKMWDSDIKVCNGLAKGALANNAAEWRLLRAAPFLCAMCGLGDILNFGKQKGQEPNAVLYMQLAKQLKKWSQPRKGTVGQKGKGEERPNASNPDQEDSSLDLTPTSSGKRGGQASVPKRESQGKGGKGGLLQLQSISQPKGDGSDKKTEMIVVAHASKGEVVPVEGPKVDSMGTKTGASGPYAQARGSTANLSVAHNGQGQDNISILFDWNLQDAEKMLHSYTQDIARRCANHGAGGRTIDLMRNLNLPGLLTCGLALSRGEWDGLFTRFTTDLPPLVDALGQDLNPAEDQYSASVRDVRNRFEGAEVLAVGVSNLGDVRAKTSQLQSLGSAILKFVMAACHLVGFLLESA